MLQKRHYIKSKVVFYRLDDFCGNAADQGVVGHVLRDHGAGCHHYVVADGHAGQDGDVAADPHVIVDAHGLGQGVIFPAALGRKRVPDGGDQRVRANHHMVAGEVVADEDVLAAVAVKGLGNPYAFAYRAEHLLQLSILRHIVAPIDGVEDLALPDGLGLERDKFLVGIGVLQAGVAFFEVGHIVVIQRFGKTTICQYSLNYASSFPVRPSRPGLPIFLLQRYKNSEHAQTNEIAL